MDGKQLIAHQGSAIYQLQYPHSFLEQFYDSIGLKHAPTRSIRNGQDQQPEMPLSRTPYQAVGLEHGQYGFWFGAKFGRKPGMLVDRSAWAKSWRALPFLPQRAPNGCAG